jgi:hypothetical protein
VPQLGAPMAPCLARELHVSLDQGESRLRGSGTLMTPWGLGRGRKMPPKAPISPKTFPQGSSRKEVDFYASSD